jgi:hypothetical protein
MKPQDAAWLLVEPGGNLALLGVSIDLQKRDDEELTNQDTSNEEADLK